MLVVLTVAALSLVAAFETHVRQRYMEEFDEHVHQLISLVQTDAADAGAILLRHELDNDVFQKPLSGLNWQINVDKKVVLRSRSLWDNALAFPEEGPAPGQRKAIDLPGPHKQMLIAVERLAIIDDQGERSLRRLVADESKMIQDSRSALMITTGYLLGVIGTLLTPAS